jgi:hypothetical protein
MSSPHRHTQANARTAAAASLFVLALLPQAFVFAQLHPEPDVVGGQGIAQPPTLEERIVEEREIADQAAAEVVLEEDHTGIEAPLDEPSDPRTHASVQASPELLALASREPERLVGKTLVLDDGVTAVEVGPVLDVRKRIVDQEVHVIVDATSYFNAPTEYAVSIRDIDRIDGERLVAPEVEGMHLRGLDYYAEDYVDVSEPSADVLARNADAGVEDEEEADGGTAADLEPGEIPIGRF